MPDLTVSSAVDTLLQASDQSGLQTAAGLVIGTNVQAWDSDLDTWAGKTPPSGTVIGTTDTQTLTNKTLTAPAITSPTGLVKADVGLGSVDNTADPSKVVASAAVLTTPRTIDGVSFNGSANIKLPDIIQIACSDVTTEIEAGNGKAAFRMPFAGTLTAVRASVAEAPTGSTIVIDINESGTTVLSTKLSIDASEKTSTTAATAAVISDSSLADDAEISIDFDQVGSSTAGKGVVVTLYVTKT